MVEKCAETFLVEDGSPWFSVGGHLNDIILSGQKKHIQFVEEALHRISTRDRDDREKELECREKEGNEERRTTEKRIRLFPM